MGIFDSLRRQPDVNISVTYVSNVMETVMGMSGADLYETQDALHAVVDFKANAIAALPLKVYTRGDDGDRQRDTKSDTALLLKYPNDSMTTFDLVSATVHEIGIAGWALWLRRRDKKSPSGWSLDPVPTSWVMNAKTDGFRILEYQICNPNGGTPQWYPADQFIRFAYYNPASPTQALSPIKPLKNILNEQINAYAFRNQLWAGQGRFNAYITRDKDAPEWTKEQRDRFLKAWKESRTGNGKLTGQIPILEDGMEMKVAQFNSKEAEWVEATQLSREAVAAVYHINPAQVWSTDGQTYASVKENARSLYVDSLGPDIRMITDVLNTFLLPSIGADSRTYVEFDLQAKLAGSFEEQATILSTAVGAPWLTRAEARERMNLPRIDGTDELIVPLNVLEGGQPSPKTPLGDGGDTGKAQVPAEKSLESPIESNLPGVCSEKGTETPEMKNEAPEGPRKVKYKGTPRIDDVQEVTTVYRKFYRRQSKSVLAAIDRSRDKGTLVQTKAADDLERDWFDMDRWNKELRDDLTRSLMRISVKNIRDILEDLGQDTSIFDDDTIRDYIVGYAEHLAIKANETTLKDLIRAVEDADSFDDPNALKSTPKGVFEYAEDVRANSAGKSVATNTKGWSSCMAVKASGNESRTMKTWVVTSSNPRPSHARLNGQTIPYSTVWEDGKARDSVFSNDLRWPGDWSYDAGEVAGCCCELEIEIAL